MLKLIARHINTASTGIKTRSTQSIREIILDRPASFNALNLEMIEEMAPNISKWQRADSCKVVLLTSEHAKAFCAGGDVKSKASIYLSTSVYSRISPIRASYQFSVYILHPLELCFKFLLNLTIDIVQALKSDKADKFETSLKFFEEEYKLNHMIATSTKPFISILNGITLGGGVGVCIHGHFRIATKNTMIAMPETAIGLAPDVGASFFLPRLDGELGLFLGMTGHRLYGKEAVIAGLATHYIDVEVIPQVIARLAGLDTDDLEAVNSAIDEFAGIFDLID